MTISQLKAVAEVMAAGSVSLAARKLYLSQPAVTKQIRALEAELEIALFERTGRRMVPTPAARALLPRIEELVRGMEDIRGTFRTSGATGVSGVALIGSGPVFSQAVIPKVAAACRRKYPDMQLVIFEGSIRDQIERLRNGEFHLALGPGYLKDADLQFETLLEDELVLITPPRHRLAKGTQRLSLAKVVRREPLITHLYAGGMEAALRQAGVPRRLLLQEHPVGARTTNTATIVALVSQGLGISVVPRYLVELLPRSGVAVRNLNPPLAIRFGYYRMRGARVNALETAFLEMLRATLARIRPGKNST